MSSMTLSPMTTFAVSPALRQPSQIRLTRRGRVVVFVAAVLLVIGAGLALGTASVATNERGSETPTRVITVSEGDTLWDIAASIADEGQAREMVRYLKDLNALDSSMLVVGQELYVPVN